MSWTVHSSSLAVRVDVVYVMYCALLCCEWLRELDISLWMV